MYGCVLSICFIKEKWWWWRSTVSGGRWQMCDYIWQVTHCSCAVGLTFNVVVCWLASEAGGNISTEPQQQQLMAAASAVDKTLTSPVAVTSTIAAAHTVDEDANLQRTQSARFAPEKRPESKSSIEPLMSTVWWLVVSVSVNIINPQCPRVLLPVSYLQFHGITYPLVLVLFVSLLRKFGTP